MIVPTTAAVLGPGEQADAEEEASRSAMPICPMLRNSLWAGGAGGVVHRATIGDYSMAKKLVKAHQAVALKAEEVKVKVAEVHEENPIFHPVRRMLTAFIGAVALASDEVENFVHLLVERGEIAEQDRRKLPEEVTERTQKRMKPAEKKSSATLTFLRYSDDVESVPSTEQDDIRQVVESIEQILQTGREKRGKALPDVHAKGHGCAKGQFKVLPNLPEELAQGLFRRPKTYDAVVRFSSGSGQLNPDFQVQLRTSEHTMPVEDATVEWPESESPYRTVATFRILKQDIAPLRVAGNDLSFTVWHARGSSPVGRHQPCPPRGSSDLLSLASSEGGQGAKRTRQRQGHCVALAQQRRQGDIRVSDRGLWPSSHEPHKSNQGDRS
jgi:polyhydroxyalkanoate synthesis regulator phasin